MDKTLWVSQTNPDPLNFSGPYIIESMVSSSYEYMTNAGAFLYLKDIANLSILIDTDDGADNERYIKLGVYHGKYDASLVIRGGNDQDDYV